MSLLITEPVSTKPVNAGMSGRSDQLNVAAFLVRQLAAWGVKRIYGVIGDAVFHLLDELSKQNEIQYIACRHEAAAAMMASAEAKLTGAIGVCMATSGPGLANLLNGLADAAMDRVPVLAVTGQVSRSKLGTKTKQYIDQQRLIEPIARSTHLVAHPDALPALLTSALTAAVADGTVSHLSIPTDLYTQQVDGTVVAYPAHLHQALHTPIEQIRETAQLLRESVHPALYIGRGVKAAAPQVKRLAEKLQAAVITTLPARSLFPNDHLQYAGGLGPAGSEASSVLLAESDLILVLGATWWPQSYVPKETTIIQIDRDPQAIGMQHCVRKGMVGDLTLVLPQLLQELGAQPDRSSWLNRVTEVTRSWKKRIETEANDDGIPLAPQRVIKAVADIVARDAVITVDTGDHTLWFDRIFQAKQHDILISGHWRTLGFALPAAVAAKLAEPNRQVVAIAGDGGAVQTLLELQTAAQHHAAVCLVVIENGCYAMEKNRMEAGGLQPLGSKLVNPDFVKLAEACGCWASGVETAAQLEQALKEALTGNKPSLIAVKTAATIVPHTAL